MQLSYTTIRAPLAGKTGNLAVTAGNLVRANDTTAMVTITTSSPIYVTFSVPERDLVRIRQASGKEGLTVQGGIPGDEGNPSMGKLSLVDNTVDPATGTVRLKATFINEDRRLYPGQFVNVVLTLTTDSLIMRQFISTKSMGANAGPGVAAVKQAVTNAGDRLCLDGPPPVNVGLRPPPFGG